jgi:hypothetical protein
MESQFKTSNDLTIIEQKCLWKAQTKYLLKNFTIEEIEGWFCDCIYELSDEQWFEKKFPTIIFNENIKPRIIKAKGIIRKEIDKHLKITDVAKKYGLDVDRKGKCECPFHNDTDPSLSLSDNKNVFYCYGCHSRGDIIEFIRMMEEIKHGKK